MNDIEVRMQRLPHSDGLPLPRYESALAAGLDLIAAVAEEAPIVIAPGERALVPLAERMSTAAAASAVVERVPPGAVKRALAWQERRLEFDSVPLAQVAAEFNRYNRQQLVIVDVTLATRRFSGTFRADGYESFVRLLETDFGVSVTHEGRELLLRVRR